MPLRNQTLCFWWQCIKIASEDSASFANDWQWLIGVPIFTVVWQHFTPLASSALVVVNDHPVVDGIVQAGIAFVLTYVAFFALRLLRAPVMLFEREQARSAELQAVNAAQSKSITSASSSGGSRTGPLGVDGTRRRLTSKLGTVRFSV
jgi:hypothetical protein